MILLIIAGPNGAGKTTIAEPLLKEIGIEEFINVDQIARGLSMLHPERLAFRAGRIALSRVSQVLEDRKDFAIETTLSSHNTLSLVKKAKAIGYNVILHLYSLPNVETAIARVKHRVELGGHNIPNDIIERRYHRGLKMFFKHIQNHVDSWFFYDNLEEPELLAYKTDILSIQDTRFTNFQIFYYE